MFFWMRVAMTVFDQRASSERRKGTASAGPSRRASHLCVDLDGGAQGDSEAGFGIRRAAFEQIEREVARFGGMPLRRVQGTPCQRAARQP